MRQPRAYFLKNVISGNPPSDPIEVAPFEVIKATENLPNLVFLLYPLGGDVSPCRKSLAAVHLESHVARLVYFSAAAVEDPGICVGRVELRLDRCSVDLAYLVTIAYRKLSNRNNSLRSQKGKNAFC